ncbi:hypothetical protein [Nostoc linckia]|uniref:hypothetical protein n=1 Tax=Nostoc linckia TaxID=92942 RepID=UPI001A7ED2FF|nr:hypothetical protein [Nostoc linckia]
MSHTYQERIGFCAKHDIPPAVNQYSQLPPEAVGKFTHALTSYFEFFLSSQRSLHHKDAMACFASRRMCGVNLWLLISHQN